MAVVETENANWIGGKRERSRGGGRFQVREATAPFEEIGSWPSSGEADAAAALEALVSPARLAATELRTSLEAAGGALEETVQVDALVRRLGLTDGEFELHRRGLNHLMAGLAQGPVVRQREVAVVAQHWTGLLAGPLRATARELLRGRAVVLVSDPHLPMAAELVLEALLATGVPTEHLALIHGLTDEGMAALLRDEHVRALHASGKRNRIQRLRRLAAEASLATQELLLLRTASHQVHAGDDIVAAAQRIVRLAFGRAQSMTGQLPGQLGRVYCEQRQFSALTEALLAELKSSESASHPVPMIDRDSAQAVRRAWSSGLDQGATLIAGGEGAAPGSENRSKELRLPPTVFTNVEPHMALLKRQTPMPIVCLVRTIEGAGRLMQPNR